MNGKERKNFENYQEDSPLFDEVAVKSIDGRFYEVRLIIDLQSFTETLKRI